LSSRSRHYHVAAFDDMIADINALGIEHVLCTGDVTNIALRKEFEFARGKFDTLTAGPTGVTVIPGNHDAYVAEGVGFFAELFGAYAATDPGWEWTAADADASDRDSDMIGETPRWPIVRIRGELAIVGLSTSRQTPWFTAYGQLGEGQLARLRRVLEDPRLAGKVRVVAIHHPPAGKRSKSRIRGLRDHEGFAEVIAAAGANLIVHGHEHRDMTEVLAGPNGIEVPVRGVVSGTYENSKPEKTARYRIFEIENGVLTRDHNRIWDREQRCFMADTGTSNSPT
jgi:3',5'-cyclic AMP phosphodiesterase CpdA